MYLKKETFYQEAEVSKKRPTFIKAKERVTHTQKKLESALKTLEQARKAHEAHQADIRKLEDELRQVEEQKAAWEQTVLGAGAGHSGRADVHLEEAQVAPTLSTSHITRYKENDHLKVNRASFVDS